MTSHDYTVQQLFQDRRQYMVPFYQRAYVWTLTDQWEQLWEDIRSKAEARLFGGKTTPHFLGAIVLDPQPRQGLMGVDTLHIIDGQQRLTTLQFILKSMSFALSHAELPALVEVISGTLHNNNPDTMLDARIESFKVWPTFRDREDYVAAFEAPTRDSLRSRFPESFTQADTLRKIGMRHPTALEAIWYFSAQFEEWITEDSPYTVSRRGEALATSILQDLKAVYIVLHEEDDAQVIFETLNGRGARLNATDLIRNFIFMRADRENANSGDLYESMWSQFEQEYWSENLRRGRIKKPRLEWFFHTLTQAALREEVDLGRLYHEYRQYVFRGDTPLSATKQLHTLDTFSEHYKALVDGDGSSPVAMFARRIAPLDTTTVHPLAITISAAACEEDEKRSMFDLLASYLVRRTIVGLTQKNYNNVFISILRRLAQGPTCVSSLRSIFQSLHGDGSRFPSDAEFRNACVADPLFPGRLDARRMRSILAELEIELRQSARTEDRFADNLGRHDVDHILPRSWFEHWPLKDGSLAEKREIWQIDLKSRHGEPLTDREISVRERQEVLPTLGNLTLLDLSVNREAQHKRFNVKKDLLLANTNLRLNVPLLGLPEWTEDTIRARSETLADAALRVWPGID